MSDRIDIAQEILSLEQQLQGLNEIFSEFLTRSQCEYLCQEENHVCALRIIHNFVIKLRNRIRNQIEVLKNQLNQ